MLHSFSGTDGLQPSAALLQANDGLLYGSTIVGGAFGLGTLFKLDPGQPASPPKLVLLTIDPPAVVGGSRATGTVTLGWAAPAGGAAVSLSTASSMVAIPGSVVVPEGAKTASFVISTKRTRQTRVATFTARYNGSQASATLAITR